MLNDLPTSRVRSSMLTFSALLTADPVVIKLSVVRHITVVDYWSLFKTSASGTTLCGQSAGMPNSNFPASSSA
jgi:hypothetical protein